MARRRRADKREIVPDPKFNSILVSQFINCLLKKGKKTLAQNILYDAVDIMADRTKQDGLSIFKKAVSNVKPSLEVKSRRIGGATYQVPIEVSPARRTALAIRWILAYSKSKKGKTMAERLADEMVQASNNDGASIKKREDTHRMAEENKALAHLRW